MSKEPTARELRRWLGQFQEGKRSKSEIERTELGDPQSQAKRITRLWRDRLGVETEGTHPLVIENERLRKLLEDHGIDPG